MNLRTFKKWHAFICLAIYFFSACLEISKNAHLRNYKLALWYCNILIS